MRLPRGCLAHGRRRTVTVVNAFTCNICPVPAVLTGYKSHMDKRT